MKKYGKILTGLVGISLVSSSIFAMSGSTEPSSSIAPATTMDSKIAPGGFVPPYYGNGVTYTYNKEDVKTFSEAKSALFKVTCDKDKITKGLGLTNPGIYSVSLEQNSYDVTYDLRNCSMNMNKSDYSYSNKTLTKNEALAMAKNFYDKELKNNASLYAVIGEPKVISRGGMVALYKGAMDSVATPASPESDIGTSGITVDTETGATDVEKEAQSYSILYPYLIGKTPIYQNYGNQVGITLEVNKDGVSSVNTPLLKFKVVKKNSDKMELSDVTSFIDRGGQSNYYGNAKEIKFKEINSAYILFSLWANNKNDNYISSGFRLESDTPMPYDTEQNFGLNISHYKIGNGLGY